MVLIPVAPCPQDRLDIVNYYRFRVIEPTEIKKNNGVFSAPKSSQIFTCQRQSKTKYYIDKCTVYVEPQLQNNDLNLTIKRV